MEATLAITMLGSPSIALEGAPVRGFVSNKAAALVYYLAATGRAHTREALAGLLWGEVSDTQAQKNLRDVLSNLRRLLDPYLEISRQSVAFASAAAELVDSRRYEARLDASRLLPADAGAGALREAIGLYHGDFLAGFSVADAPGFDEWALVERERLRRLALDALQRLASYAADHGDPREGMAYATQLLALDPLREEAHRLMMLLLARAGQRGAALAQYETCRRVLSDELGIDPDDETEALYRRLLDGESFGVQQAPPSRPIYQVPTPLTPFIGREIELAQIVDRLRDPACRLLTITGTGGVGKTRVALQAAYQLRAASEAGQRFAHGIAFVGLAAVEAYEWRAPGNEQAAFPAMAARIADALRFTFSGQEAPHVELAHYLTGKDLLLVLDSCEHLPVAHFVVELLEQAPRLTVLATSRGRLNLRGEAIVELAGLSFPRHSEAIDPAQLDSYSAIQLFRHTAEAVSTRLAWTPDTAEVAARICALVDGLPLAIELAASMVRLLSCEEIAREIADNLNFLQLAGPDRPERHQSLRAVFEHSWKLLQPSEQRLLGQLAVFRGGFTREAAARVAGAAFPVLMSLVDNSLVRRSTGEDTSAGRYELPELVRQYGTEKLVLQGSGDEQIEALDRHCRYYLSMLRQRKQDLRGGRQQAAAAEISLDIANIRGAWHWALAEGHADLIGQAVEGLFYFYEMRGWFQEGAVAFANAATRLSELPSHAISPQHQLVLGQVLARQGWCEFQIGRQGEGRRLLEQSLAILRPLGVAAALVFPLNYLASAAYYSGDYAEANQIVEEALAHSVSCGDRHGRAVAKTVLGQIAYLVGRYEDARRHSRESLAIERELDNRWGMVFALISLGRVDQALGAYAEAQRSFQEGLEIRAMLGDVRGIAVCLNYLGDTAEAVGDYEQARQRFQESLARFNEIGHRSGAAMALARLGYNALARGEPAAAGTYFRQSLRTAWQARATPRVLEALAGIATVLADDRLEQAAGLAKLVRDHPAAIQESRDRAGAVLARLKPAPTGHTRSAAEQQEAQALEDVIAALLTEPI